MSAGSAQFADERADALGVPAPPFGLLSKWLSPLALADFEQRIFNKAAWASPGVAAAEAKAFGWSELDELLRAQPTPDVLVVARGALLQLAEPRSLRALRTLMSRGVGVCVRHAEQQHSALSRLASELGAHFDVPVHAQVFATPSATHGFSWHYDAEHVFILQTAGIKDYYFRENTVDLRRPASSAPDFSRIRAERSALRMARLLAGDCLYIPARWWHMAHCIEASLSVSLGVSEHASTQARGMHRANPAP